MNILLLRPHPGNDRFGLGPFFREPWDFVERHGLQRAGFTILTPLPGTDFYREMEDRIPAQPWSNFDMHHLLWEPQYPPPSAKGPDPSKLPPGSPFPPRPSL